MRILVLGAGAIGSVIGGLLAKGGHEVCLLGRAAHIDSITHDGLLIDGIWGVHRIRNLTCYSSLRQIPSCVKSYDVALLTVKSYDTEPMLAELNRCLKSIPPVVSLQNGLGNIEKVAAYCGRRNTIGGRVIFGVEYIREGHVRVTVEADRTVIGGLSRGADTEIVAAIARAFTDAGIMTEATHEIEKYIWGKVLYNCALNGLATLINTNYGRLLMFEGTRQTMRNIVSEIFLITAVKEIRLSWGSADEFIQLLFDELIPKTFGHHPSMLQDIQRGKRTEIDALNGALVALGSKIGIDLPYNNAITLLVKAREAVGLAAKQAAVKPFMGKQKPSN